MGILGEAKPNYIIGNIVLPSQPIEGPIEEHIEKLGLQLVNTKPADGYKPPGTYDGYTFEVPGITGDYYIICGSAENFRNIIQKCTENKQLPPYTIMTTGGDKGPLTFSADENAKIRSGKIVSYRYKRAE